MLFTFLLKHGFIGVNPGLGFRMPSFGRHFDPFKLPLQGFLPFRLFFLLNLQPFLLLFQPGRIIPFPWNTLTTIQLQNPASHIIKKITVMGNGNNRTRIPFKMLFKPGNRFCIQMIGRLIKKEDIRILQQQPAQSHPAFLASRQYINDSFSGRTAQSVHGHLQFTIKVPGIN